MAMTPYTDRTELAALRKATDGGYLAVYMSDGFFAVLANANIKEEWIVGQELDEAQEPRYGEDLTYFKLSHITRLRRFPK